jgi:hypothetical protein
MKTEILIHNLALQCRPVKTLDPPFMRFLKWVALTTLLLAVGVVIMKPRPGFAEDISEPAFLLPLVALLILSLVCALSAFVMTVPDERNGGYVSVSIALVVLSFASVAFATSLSDVDSSRPGLLCMTKIILLSLVPAGVLFYMLSKAAPMRSGLIGLLAALSALTSAATGAQFLCHKIYWPHILVWHLLPVCILAALGFVVGRFIFRN